MSSSSQDVSGNYGVCPKCGFKRVAKEGTYRMETKFAMSFLFVDAYVCNNCGYVEFYKMRQ
jgi:DNA-directed RNA polymerase subunit RPC12/RpoP